MHHYRGGKLSSLVVLQFFPMELGITRLTTSLDQLPQGLIGCEGPPALASWVLSVTLFPLFVFVVLVSCLEPRILFSASPAMLSEWFPLWHYYNVSILFCSFGAVLGVEGEIADQYKFIVVFLCSLAKYMAFLDFASPAISYICVYHVFIDLVGCLCSF